MNLFRPLSLRRLETTLQIFEAELDASEGDQRSWDERAKQLLDTAWHSLNEGDTEKGWRCLKASDRVRLNGVGEEELKSEARVILTEVRDKSDEISKWRRETIVSLLEESDELKPDITPLEVIRAKRTLDEHHDNVYHKLLIFKSRLRLLTLVGVLAIALWIIRPPLSPAVRSLALATGDNPAVTTSISPPLALVCRCSFRNTGRGVQWLLIVHVIGSEEDQDSGRTLDFYAYIRTTCFNGLSHCCFDLPSCRRPESA